MTKSNDIPIHPIPKIEMIWQADIRQLTKAISGLATALNKYGDVKRNHVSPNKSGGDVKSDQAMPTDTPVDVFNIGSIDDRLNTSTPDTPDQLEKLVEDIYGIGFRDGKYDHNDWAALKPGVLKAILQLFSDCIGPDIELTNEYLAILSDYDAGFQVGVNIERQQIRNNLGLKS